MRKLEQRKHRQRQGRFLVEGLQLLHMALEAGARPIEVCFCQSQFAGAQASALLQRLRDAGAELVLVSPQVMQSLSQPDVCQGLVATFPLLQVDLQAVDLGGDELVVILDRLHDPGNLGTLIRTAEAVGAAAAILIEPCADPFGRKAVRGSAGSLFSLPLVVTQDVRGTFAWLCQRGFRLVGADSRLGRMWGEDLWRGGVALTLGNEARGVSPDVRDRMQGWARLPIVGGAESLNVAVAGGVLMYAWLRENLPGEVV